MTIYDKHIEEFQILTGPFGYNDDETIFNFLTKIADSFGEEYADELAEILLPELFV